MLERQFGPRTRRLTFWILACSWVFLFLWAFLPVRLWVVRTAVTLAGFASAGNERPTSEFLDITEFEPTAVLVPVSAHPVKRPRYPVIEFHGHVFGDSSKDFDSLLQQTHIRTFVDLAARTATLESYRKLKARYPSRRVIHFVALDWKHSRTGPDFGRPMAAQLESLAREGARGVKLWKNFGLMERDVNGRLIPLDDARLDPVWDVCARYNLVVAIHTADPPAFFAPIDKHNERFGELGRRPFWSFRSAELPSFSEVMNQRSRMFRRRRDVTFVAVHFGELAHDLRGAESLLREHPNVYLDIAQRIDELGRQPRAARAFLIRWSDRILYGTDGLPDLEKSRIYWRFLETTDEYFPYHPAHKPRKGLWNIYGLGLPDRVLRKIYYENARRLLRITDR